MQHPAVQPISFSYSFKMLSSDSPGTLSLFAKITKLLAQKAANHTCNATVTYSHMQLRRCHLFSTFTTTARNPIAYIWQIYHTAMGHRYFNLAMTCDICLRYDHASHKPASAFRLPTL